MASFYYRLATVWKRTGYADIGGGGGSPTGGLGIGPLGTMPLGEE